MSSPVLTPWQTASLVASKVLFCLAFGVLAAHLFWQIVAPEPVYLIKPVKPSAQKANQPAASELDIARHHVFGVPGALQEKKVVDAPETRLQLQLMGVTVAERAQKSSAIIATKGGESEFYHIDDRVPGGATLKEVHRDRVILSNRGKLETLKFEKMANTGVVAQAVPRAPVRGRVSSTSTSSNRLADKLKRVRNTKEFLSLAKRELDADMEGTVRQLGLKATGQGQGYEVQSGSMLTAINLRPGDTVLSINGSLLGDVSADRLTLQDAMNSDQVRLEVRRGDRRFVVTQRIK